MPVERRNTLIKGQKIRCGDHAVVLHRDGPASSAEPTIKITREEGVIRQILITCACGQVIRLDCRYAEDGPTT